MNSRRRAIATIAHGRRYGAALAGAIFAFAIMHLAAAKAAEIEIVAIGDSNTAGDGVGSRVAWPAIVEKHLRAKGYDVRIVNAGVSGDQSGDALARLDRVLSPQTTGAIVFLGRNDRRFRVPKDHTRANIGKILATLKSRGISTLLVGFYGYDFTEIAAAQDALYYPDFFVGVGRNGKKFRRYILPLDLFQHLNPSGHAKVAEGILPEVEKLVERAAKR